MTRPSIVFIRLVLPRLPLLVFILFSTWTPWVVSRPSANIALAQPHSVYGRSTDPVELNATPRNCTREKSDFPQVFGQDELGKGAILLHVFAVLYVSGCIGYLCHAYFVPSLEIICEEWKIPHDVAGATIMAAGTSLPELFAAIMGTFVTEDDTGTGAIVGSAAFNIYAILALCSFLAPKEGVKIAWFPVVRDAFYWSVCMLVLIAIVIDGKLFWWESLILSLLYVVYVILMVFNTPISECVQGWLNSSSFEFLHCNSCSNLKPEDHIELTESHALQDTDDELTNNELDSAKHSLNQSEEDSLNEKLYKKNVDSNDETNAIKQTKTPAYGTSYDQAEYIAEALNKSKSDLSCKSNLENGVQYICSPVFDPPEGWLFRVVWIAGLPFVFMCCLTIPDCRKPGLSRQLYIVTFVMSAVWCSVTCYLLFWVVTVIGTFFGIPDIVMGYTLLAIGTSLPDAISSAIVSKHGHPDMAIANISGSNTFEVIIALGMVWLAKSLLNNCAPVMLHTAEFSITASILVLCLVVTLIILRWNDWVLDRKIAIVSIILYVLFLILAVLLCLYYSTTIHFLTPF